jgi:hypothetical protein
VLSYLLKIAYLDLVFVANGSGLVFMVGGRVTCRKLSSPYPLPSEQRVAGSNPVRFFPNKDLDNLQVFDYKTIRLSSPSSSPVQDTGLSRRQHRFKSGWGRQINQQVTDMG